MELVRRVPTPVWVVLVALIVSGLLYGLVVRPGEQVRRRERQEYERRFHEVASAASALKTTAESASTQNAFLERQLAEQERRLNNIQTTTSREIVRVPVDRFIPVPGTPGASQPPVVVIQPRDGSDGGLPGNRPSGSPGNGPEGISPKDVVEIIRETIRTEDRSSVERGKTEVEKSGSEAMMTAKSAVEMETLAKVEVEEKITAKVEKQEDKLASANSDGGRIGVGVTESANPFLSLDLLELDLGPRPLGLGKLGAGVFGEFDLDLGGVSGGWKPLRDFGPQANYTRKQWFGMVGWGVKSEGPRFGIGWKF
jgi:hypothetical protein